MKISSTRHLRRRDNLLKLIAEAGSASALAQAIGTPKSHVSALVSGTRGLGDDLAAKIERRYDRPAGWLDQDGGNRQDVTASAANSDQPFPQAHGVSQPAPIVEVPHLTWEALMAGPLPATFEITITDDSMAPEFPAGTLVRFSTDVGDARARDAVLVGDRDGNVFFREYRFKKPGHWQAVALADGYEPLDSIADHLEVRAIMTSYVKVGRRSR
ncbi:hypothetical protein [Aquincola tertiaricarbonis]|uniref:hypothetical protein n=1 Tax=Aquincola tertiaricarbonis TaxID=391953 RepID=UPI0012EED3C7|nr:hypothetical protein [Aquincola tertiaricarbonis]